MDALSLDRFFLLLLSYLSFNMSAIKWIKIKIAFLYTVRIYFAKSILACLEFYICNVVLKLLLLCLRFLYKTSHRHHFVVLLLRALYIHCTVHVARSLNRRAVDSKRFFFFIRLLFFFFVCIFAYMTNYGDALSIPIVFDIDLRIGHFDLYKFIETLFS